jgi:UTP--glucose-1-phosphate uridylyltransferase
MLLNAGPMSAEGLRAAEERMRADGQHPEAILAFRRAYERLESGESGYFDTADLEPATGVPALEELPAAVADDALAGVVSIKLNGGLATTMGLRGPKSLMEARDGRSFLDLIVAQTLALRERHGIRLPLLLMDSEATCEETRAALAAYPALPTQELADLDFMQSMEPKLLADTLEPASWPANPALEWCPPGHGDVYGALRRSGMLATLLEHGFRYAMISNADNLGAAVEPRISSHMASERIPFLMETVLGTEADRKGGHIAARRSDGQLILRESAQTPPEDQESFRDYRRWRYYNTNSLWIDLHVLSETLEKNDGLLELPLIVNRKTVDPRDSSTPEVIQLETAMGAAIGSFRGARVLCVPRTRFAPVKTTDDLLVLRSDAYRVTDGSVVEPAPERVGSGMPYVELDPSFYKLMDAFEQRFPDGPPSLARAERLVVHGDVTFGPGVVVRGAVTLEAPEPRTLEPGTILHG